MGHVKNQPPATQRDEADNAVRAVVDLMAEMIRVIDEENRLLSGGLPASVAGTCARKNKLADEFADWANRVRTAQIKLGAADPKLRTKLVESAKMLRETMDENVKRLRTAMEASRRRIDAVMSAIREQMAAKAPYSANGRRDEQTGQVSLGNVWRSA